MTPTTYHSCFISYASKDQTFAEELQTDLRAAGVSCWYAPEDLKIGEETRTAIDTAISANSKLLLILSTESVNSDWVKKEVETAFEKERDSPKTLVLFPIRLDDAVITTNQAWAADIRRMRNIGDFRQWKDPAMYHKALTRLLRDLRT
jgi:predicted ABC-type transport system involved in lysophospholipase L1 biosynthesis ATPase subunit